MEDNSQKRRIVGTFSDSRNTGLAADVARKAGFAVERPSSQPAPYLARW